MTAYLARRLVEMIPVVILVTAVSFALIFVLPGDPAMLIIGDRSAGSPELYESLRRDLGLDRPYRRGAGRQRLPRFQPQHRQERVVAWLQHSAAPAAKERLGLERNHQVERLADLEADEPPRHHAHDRHGHAIDDKRRADDVRGAYADLTV